MHTNTPAETTTTITVSVCLRCGTIGKSDKMSCCGRGGSWFKHCGGAGNTNLHHTWYEGVQACKSRSQSKTVIGHQLHVTSQKDMDSSQGADMSNNKAVIEAHSKTNTSTLISDTELIVTSTYTSDTSSINTSPRTLIMNISSNALMTSSTRTPISTSITAQGCEQSLLKIIININILFIIIF